MFGVFLKIMYFHAQRHCSRLTSQLSILHQSKVNMSSRKLPHFSTKKPHIPVTTHTRYENSSHLANEKNTHPSPLKKYSKSFNPYGIRQKREGSREKQNKRTHFKFRPTVQFGLAAFPHAPDTVNPSTTPSSLSSPRSSPASFY